MKNIVSFVKSLCTPAIVSLFLGVLSVLFSITTVSIFYSILHLGFTTVWALFLDFLCQRGLGALSWALVLLPYIIILCIILFVFGAVFSASSKQDQDKTT